MMCAQGLRLRCSLERIVGGLRAGNTSDSLLCPFTQIEDADERAYTLRLFCPPFLEGVHDQTAHFDRLDCQLSRLLPSRSSDGQEQPSTGDASIQAFCSKVQSLLSRLPQVPQRSLYLPLNSGLMRKEGSTLWDGIKSGSWAAKYILPEARAQLQQHPGLVR